MPFLKKKNKRSVINAFCKFVVKQHRKQLDEYNDKKRKKPDRNGLNQTNVSSNSVEMIKFSAIFK